LPVHWPLCPAPFPPLVGGDGFANAGAEAVARAALAKRIAPSLRALVMFTSLPEVAYMTTGTLNECREVCILGESPCGPLLAPGLLEGRP
jgi:hypothetical protein